MIVFLSHILIINTCGNIYKKRKEIMKVNVNHPSFTSFIDEITKTILNSISIENYFSLSNDSKLGVQFIAYKFINNAISTRVNVNDDELKSFINVLWLKNVENEMYEFAAVLKDILDNFERVNREVKQPVKKATKKTIKVNKENES